MPRGYCMLIEMTQNQTHQFLVKKIKFLTILMYLYPHMMYTIYTTVYWTEIDDGNIWTINYRTWILIEFKYELIDNLPSYYFAEFNEYMMGENVTSIFCI